MLEQFINKIKAEYINKISFGDFKNVAKNQMDSLKDVTKQRLEDMKKTSHKVSKDSVRTVFSTLGKVGYGIGSLGWYLSKIYLNNTRAGLYTKILAITYFTGRAGYVYGTKHTETVIVDKMWTPNSNTETDEYMMSTNKGKVYILKNSPWYLQYKSAEIWAKMRKGESYQITSYGLMFPLVNIHPRIVRAKQIYD